MKTHSLKLALALAGLAFATQAAAQVTLYEREGFEGRSFTTERQIGNLGRQGFNDRASSMIIRGERTTRWEVCERERFDGRCWVLRPGRYPSLAAMGMNDRVSSLREIPRGERIADDRYGPRPLPQPVAQVTFFEQEGFRGRSFTTNQPVVNFRRHGFNNRASSAVVTGERWEVCEDRRFEGRCVVLRQGQYPTLRAMGLNDEVSSVRPVESRARVDDGRYAPMPAVPYDYRRRANERIYEAQVTSVRAVVGTPERRCWIERQPVEQGRGEANVPAAIAGAVIGGILGHQIGGGSGRDIATVGGVVAGAAVGANVGRDGRPVMQDVQRCTEQPAQVQPNYYDVVYNFRGQEHRVQMAVAPGRTITVNEAGEPRV